MRWVQVRAERLGSQTIDSRFSWLWNAGPRKEGACNEQARARAKRAFHAQPCGKEDGSGLGGSERSGARADIQRKRATGVDSASKHVWRLCMVCFGLRVLRCHCHVGSTARASRAKQGKVASPQIILHSFTSRHRSTLCLLSPELDPSTVKFDIGRCCLENNIQRITPATYKKLAVALVGIPTPQNALAQLQPGCPRQRTPHFTTTITRPRSSSGETARATTSLRFSAGSG
eukprot:1386080-Rhodomonas_salina.2